MKNSLSKAEKNPIKSKYVVCVHVLSVDKTGKPKSENLDYTFDEGELLEKRRCAIEKAQEIINSLENSDKIFSSPIEAQLKQFKNFNAYSIDIRLIIEDEGEEYDYQIYGDDEIVYEALEVEAKFFKQEFEIIKFITIQNDENEDIVVIEESIDFLLF
jgi:hypothetical protein